jgi:hypothetical protein
METLAMNDDLPQARDFEVAAVTEYLRYLRRSNRPPEASARVLIFAVHMHWCGRAWPIRPVIAAHLGIPEITLDVVLRQRGEQGLLRRVVTYKPRRTLYVIPHDHVMGVVAGSRFQDRPAAA